ncbi:hypothetical protein ABR737_05650 [Streptomyces sp. Edi2]|uniref:hypothetical protein n=1 Tax=Streptomyces sp. Edi2 TaxID=3162528 RepID=UPI00330636A5
MKRPKGKSHNGWEKLANTGLARLRAPAERPFAHLKSRRVLHKIRTSFGRATALLHAPLADNQQQRSLART